MRDHQGVFNISSDLNFAKGIIYADNCEGTFNWIMTGTGADFAGSHHADAAQSGTNGMKLLTRATDPATNDYVRAQKYFEYPGSGLLVTRAKICLPDISDVSSIEFQWMMFDGTRKWYAGIKYKPSTPLIQCTNAAGTYETVADFTFDTIDKVWRDMEVIIDLTNKTWYSAAMMGESVDRSDVGLNDDSASTARYIDMSIFVTAVGANQTEAWVDNIYVGQYLNV